jgi:comEA protein
MQTFKNIIVGKAVFLSIMILAMLFAAAPETAYADEGGIPPVDTDTLYALEAKTFTVIFDPNGGKAISSETKTKTVKLDSAYGDLAKTSRAGYTFKGWYTAKNGGSKITKTTIVQTANDHTLYAQWKAKKYTVTLNANGGTVSPVSGGAKAKSTKMSVTYAKKFGKLPTPTRTGCKFAGWYTAKSGGKKITKSTVVKITKNTTYYAHWNVSIININTADYDTLQLIYGVGPVIAQRIIDYREAHGPFERIEDIQKVKGIGAKTFEKMKNQICV